MRRLIAAFAVCCALCCGAAGAAAPAGTTNCQLKRYATLPITITGSGRITVPIKVEGQILNLLVDTGGYATALSEAAATRLKLQKQFIATGDWLFGMGGQFSKYGASANLEVAGIPITGKAFNLMPEIETGADGLLGADILSVFDVDIDYLGGKLSLYSPARCPGKVVYWTNDPYAVVPFDFTESQRKMLLSVDVDGHSMSAYLDTGASTSMMIYEEAKEHFDVDKEVLHKDRRFPFKRLSFEGGVTVADPDIRLFGRLVTGFLGSGDGPEMLIGADILRQLHVYIAFKEEKVYMTPVPATASSYSHLLLGMDATAKKDFGLAISHYTQALDSGGLIPDQRRRALLDRAKAISVSSDCGKSLADLNSVLAMSPDDAEAHETRARVKVCLHDKSALADADFVIARDPYWKNYFTRGQMNWSFGEFAAAAADFDKTYELEKRWQYGLLWFALSAARAGTLDRAAFVERASAVDRVPQDRFSPAYEWPAPILSVYMGKEDADADLQKSIAKEKSADHSRQCEADFYIGEWRLAGGQAADARKLLQKAADECPAEHIERLAAKTELARLPKD